MNRDYFGYVLALVSIVVSALVSWYFYDKSLEYREPHYMTEIVPQSVFDAETDPNPPFKVLKSDGSLLASSVFIANHQFWNAGKQPILELDVLKPITVSFLNKDTNILAVSVAKVSREVTDCGVILDSKTNKSFKITFRVLEKNDGCLIKIFYTGSQYPNLKIAGEVIGVNSIALHNETINEVLKRPAYKRYMNFLPEMILFIAMSVFIFLYIRSQNLPKKTLWIRAATYSVVIFEVALITHLLIQRQYQINSGTKSPNVEEWISPNAEIRAENKEHTKTLVRLIK